MRSKYCLICIVGELFLKHMRKHYWKQIRSWYGIREEYIGDFRTTTGRIGDSWRVWEGEE